MRDRKKRLFLGLSAVAMASCGAGMPAYAQEAKASPEDRQPTDLVVTGSRIVRDGYDAPSPVTVATVKQLLESAPTNLPDALNKLPQFLGSSSPRNNRHSATSTPEHGNLINLRGVGASRTLILMDGRRVPPTTFLGAVDVNVLPQLLVKRVDVVTAGASAVYGSDAVTGVVNFVVDDTFEGIKGLGQYGLSTRGDGRNYRVGAAIGRRVGERLHVLLSAEYFKSIGLDYGDRAVGRRDIFGVGTTGVGAPGSATNPLAPREFVRNNSFTSGGLVTSGPFSGTSFFEPGVFRPLDRGTPTGSPNLAIGGEGFVYPQDRTLIAPLKTWQAFGRVSYELTDTINFHTQAILSKATVGYEGYANGLGFQTAIFSGNPYLPAALQQRLTAANAPSFNISKVYAAEGVTPAKEDTDFRSFGAHLDGEIGGSLKWAVDYDYGRSRHEAVSSNVMEFRRLVAALDAVDAGRFAGGAANGQIVCRVSLTNPGLYPGCAPLNPFGNGASSSASRDFVTDTLARYVAKTTQHNVSATVAGDLFDTWAGTIAFSAGVEYREQTLSLSSNSNPAVSIPVTGLRGSITPTSSRFLGSVNIGSAEGKGDVKEVFGELNIPLARDAPFLESLDLSGAFRHTDYSTSGGVDTWKIGSTWSPVEGVTFRGTYSRDIRAPTLYDLFAGRQTTILSAFDPHTNTLPVGGSTIVRGGNRDLRPEIGKTLTFGGILRPAFAPGFALSLDYYRLRISEAITLLPSAQILQLCENSNGTSPICDQISRPLPFSDRTPANQFTEIRETLINAAFLRTEGFDLDASYQTRLSGGALTARLYMNYVTKFARQNTSLSPTIEYAGNAGISPITREIRAEGIPKLRGSFTLAYEQGPFRASLQETMFGRVRYGDVTQRWVDGTGPVKPVFYTDLTTSFRMPRAEKAELFLTVNNLFDRKPPLVVSGTSTPGVNPATLANLYDIEGRRFTVGVRFGM